MSRRNVSTGGPWEGKIGYSRAVRVGAHVQVSGTTAMTPSGLVGKGDPYAQTLQTLKTIEAALQQAGAALSDVVRTRIFMADIDQWQEVGRAHGEIFGSIRPATTMAEVKRLIDPDMLVEIEADAILPWDEGSVPAARHLSRVDPVMGQLIRDSRSM
ncbi:MAG: RidA family protein [Nitrospiraceae bacterium]